MLGYYLISSGISLVVDYLWFDSLGYLEMYLSILSAQFILGTIATVAAFLIFYFNCSYALKQIGKPVEYLPMELQATPLGILLTRMNLNTLLLAISVVVSLLTGIALAAGWETPLLHFNRTDFNEIEPVFNQDVGFYIFSLPFFNQIQSFLWSIGFLTLIGMGALYFLRLQATRPTVEANVIDLSGFPAKGRLHLGIFGGVMLLILAAGVYLSRFEEMHQAGELLTGPGYADIYGTLPLLALKTAVAIVAAGLLVFTLVTGRFKMLLGVGVVFGVIWIGGSVYVSMLQRFVVVPNELEKERNYLEQHIQATNKAFGLDKVVERTLDKTVELTAEDIAQNKPTINNVRLWDHEPLLDTFAQIQEIRTYYEFVSVDNDRYMINGELRQTMLSPRELSSSSLASRSWVNERLTYTHGYGLTAGPVNRVNEQGLPVLFVKDLPPSTENPELNITEPEIYFGELPSDYVFVKTKQKEFNYPKGDTNIFSEYNGKGGVVLDSFLKRLLFAVYLKDFKMLLSDDFRPDTRVLMRRNLFERIQTLAPFFHYDTDPYLVIHEGRLVWIFDGYTISPRYPYAEMVKNVGNYMRNPIKGVVDAKDGSVTFYLVDQDEPIAKSYAKMFPGLLRPLSDMPKGLQAHLRHPAGLFNVQASLYATYHMLDVNTFYNKEDQWSIPVVSNKRMEPYYTVMKLPEEKSEEFILMLPFTPRLKDNLSAWMVARSDGENLGKLVVYTFPKQKLIYGPKQIVARINQDPEVSQQITLWDQSGSNVIRGTLLVIPIESSLIYIQPLYLRADDGRIPELKRVIVGYQNDIAMGIDLEDALAQIFGESTGLKARARVEAGALPSATSPAALPSADPLSRRAQRQFNTLNDAAKAGDWGKFGEQLKALGETLDRLNKEQGRQP